MLMCKNQMRALLYLLLSSLFCKYEIFLVHNIVLVQLYIVETKLGHQAIVVILFTLDHFRKDPYSLTEEICAVQGGGGGES